MPLSGSVTAGSAALASQYNNLRTDVVSTTQGHTHTGAAENGAQIEGTALKATGATNGYVLTANGAGGVSFAASSGPTVSTVYGTAAFSTATNNGGSALLYEGAGAAGVFYVTTTGNGSVVAAIATPDTGATTGHIITTWNTGGTTRTGGTAWANVVAGTAWFLGTGQGFSTATSQGFIVREYSKTGSVLTTTIRKFTNALTNSWNTQVFSGTVVAGTLAAQGDGGPFSQLNGYSGSYNGARFAAGPNIWIGGDYRPGADFTTAGTSQQTSLWIINDATGSAYSAPFGSATASPSGSHIACFVFIPSSTAATNGTVHAWGVDNANARYVTYAVGSASISAIATANYTYTGATWADLTDNFVYPVVGRIAQAMWIESESKLMVTTSDSIIFTDRTVGTVLAQSNQRPGASSISPYNIGRNTMGCIDSGNFDPTTRWATTNNSNTFSIVGSFDDLAVPYAHALGMPTGYTSTSTLCGPGSATFIIGVNTTSGTAYRWDIAGFAKVQLDASSTANRLFTIAGGNGFMRDRIISIAGGGSATDMGVGHYGFGPIPFIASGTQAVTVNISPSINSTSLFYLSTTTPPAAQTIGGTAIVKATKVALA